MLTDETCWFLAADFDKGALIEDVQAFVQTCHRFDIPYAIGRSLKLTGSILNSSAGPEGEPQGCGE